MSGVMVNMQVIDYEGNPVGIVTKVDGNYTEVQRSPRVFKSLFPDDIESIDGNTLRMTFEATERMQNRDAGF